MIEIMWFEAKQTFKNIAFLIGAVFLLFTIIYLCKPYINYLPPKSEQDLIQIVKETGDEEDAHIPVRKEERYDFAVECLKENLIKSGMKDETIKNIIDKIYTENMSFDEIDIYLLEECRISGASNNYIRAKSKRASLEETKLFIANALEKEPFSAYFARRYADLLGILCVFYVLMIFPFLFGSDFKKDMWDLLHTKSIKPWKYVLGKTLGALLAILSVLVLVGSVFSIWLQIKGANFLLPINFFDIWKYTAWWVLPTVLFSTFLLVALSLSFRTGIAAVPIYIAYFLWSGMPHKLSDGSVFLPVNPFFMYIRYPKLLFEDVDVARLEAIFVNRMTLISLTIVLVWVSIKAWERRIK